MAKVHRMMRQIIIGKEGKQPFPIKDDYVSRQHAVFTHDEKTGLMRLTDNGSANGTFIKMGNQYQQISQCTVDANTYVRLGPFFTFRIGQLLVSPPPKKVDIAYLRKVAEVYENNKIRLEQKQASINSLRTLSLVGSLAAGIISPIITDMVGENPAFYYKVIGPIIALIFLVTLQMYCSKASKDVIAKKSLNEKKYKISFCCPECHLPFSGKLYENILAEGKCPRCKIDYYDSNI